MNKLKVFLGIAVTVFAVQVQAQNLACTKIGFEPGTPDPNRCFLQVNETTAVDVEVLAAQAAKPQPDTNKPVSLEAATPVERPLVQRVPAVDLSKKYYTAVAQAASLDMLAPSAAGKVLLNAAVASYAGRPALGVTVVYKVNASAFVGAGASAGSGSKPLVKLSVGYEF